MNDGGQAFPVPGGEGNYAECGMSLRDWFAGQALAASDWSDWHKDVDDATETIASRCYSFADALLAERGKGA